MENTKQPSYYEFLKKILISEEYENEEYEKLINVLNTFNLEQQSLAYLFFGIGECSY